MSGCQHQYISFRGSSSTMGSLEHILTSCTVSMGLKVQRQYAKRGLPAMLLKCIEWLDWALPFHHVLTSDLVDWRTPDSAEATRDPHEIKSRYLSIRHAPVCSLVRFPYFSINQLSSPLSRPRCRPSCTSRCHLFPPSSAFLEN